MYCSFPPQKLKCQNDGACTFVPISYQQFWLFFEELKQTILMGKGLQQEHLHNMAVSVCLCSPANHPQTVSRYLFTPSMSRLVHHGGVTWMATTRGIQRSCWESAEVGRGATIFLFHYESESFIKMRKQSQQHNCHRVTTSWEREWLPAVFSCRLKWTGGVCA